MATAGRLRIALTHVYSWPEVRRGGERYLHEVAAALSRAGHLVQILSTAPRPERGDVLGVPVRRFRRRQALPSRLGDQADEAAFALQAGAVLAGRRIDVWHALGTADAAAAALLSEVRGVRSVYTSLGVPSRTYRDTRPDRRLHDLVARRVDRYVCLSGFAAQGLRDGWGREAAVVPGGVDLSRFSPGPRHPRPALLYSGNLDEPRKNVGLLLRAFRLLSTRRADAELWISGQGDRSRLPTNLRLVDLGVGGLDDLAGQYSRAWVTVLPSEDEAFGLVLVESLASGTPIVVLEGSGGPEEIATPGTGVVACGERSADNLASAMEEALELASRADTAEACRSRAECFDWQRGVVDRLLDLYTRAG